MADIINAMTERLLADAGISAGMRVLDVGCARGDVTFMVARLVGEEGQVLGLDRDARPLAVARERARDLGFLKVTFSEALNVSTICSSWTGTGDKSIGGAGVVVSFSAVPDVLTVTAAGCTFGSLSPVWTFLGIHGMDTADPAKPIDKGWPSATTI